MITPRADKNNFHHHRYNHNNNLFLSTKKKLLNIISIVTVTHKARLHLTSPLIFHLEMCEIIATGFQLEKHINVVPKWV